MARIVARHTKAPAEVIDVAIAWTVPSGDSVASATWEASGGVTLGTGAKAPTLSNGVAVAWAEGGSDGDRSLLVCRVVTAQGRVEEAGVRIDVAALA